ncbi:hypothetical protein [Paenibacillus hexagrammi]|uniref:Uncharacterized protein n=1 Tax=Paenibacillus hexagrammi TaxID=2908839 RepID=A0ABY3SK73_9BACL|nr:hypothetical protein [Paenibacillus sp. YPD9-1]UJF34233.1 hypothetical protein L0M14_03095 [Paenibacillus sp. YPD9-1]
MLAGTEKKRHLWAELSITVAETLLKFIMLRLYRLTGRLRALLVCMCMLSGMLGVPHTQAASANNKVQAADAALAPVYLNDVSYVELEQLYVLPEEQGTGRASFTLIVHNQGSNELVFDDYWVRLVTRSGTTYMPQLIPQDKNKHVILPGASERLTFYASVGQAVKEQDLIIKLFKWDFSQADFESPVGEIAIPDAGYSAAAAEHTSKRVYMSGVPVETLVKRVLLNKNDKNNLVTVYVSLANKGDLSFEVPDYRYDIRTADGALYPVQFGKSGKSSPIHPGESKEIQLTSTIPAQVKLEDGWELIVSQKLTVTDAGVEKSLSVPVASFLLSVTEGNEMPVGEAVDFSTKDGIYRASFRSIQRLPWEEQDILAAELLIENTGTKSLPIPVFKGYFMLDDAVKVEASIVKSDDMTGFAGDSAIHFQALGKVAYNYKFTKVKFVLQELDEDDATNDLAEFFMIRNLPVCLYFL